MDNPLIEWMTGSRHLYSPVRVPAVGVLVIVLAACLCLFSPPPPVQAAPILTVTMTTSPQAPFDFDTVKVFLTVHDATGAPVDGAHVRVYLQRDASGHVHSDHVTKATGTWSAPIDATPTGDPGVYQVTTVFPQSGKWFLRTTVETPEGLNENVFVLRLQANSGTGLTNLGWVELGTVVLALLVALVLTILFGEGRRRVKTTALQNRS